MLSVTAHRSQCVPEVLSMMRVPQFDAHTNLKLYIHVQLYVWHATWNSVDSARVPLEPQYMHSIHTVLALCRVECSTS